VFFYSSYSTKYFDMLRIGEQPLLSRLRLARVSQPILKTPKSAILSGQAFFFFQNPVVDHNAFCELPHSLDAIVF